MAQPSPSKPRAAALRLAAAADAAAAGLGPESDAVQRATAWAVTHGLVSAQGRANSHRVTHSPFCLLPTPFPRRLFSLAVSLQPTFNQLIDRVARDADFVRSTLSATGAADPFTGRLMLLHKELYCGTGASPQPLMLGLFRADYMVHAGRDVESLEGCDRWAIQQVEVNTISSAFAGLAPATNQLHRYVLGRLLVDSEADVDPEEAQLPTEMNSEDAFPDAIAEAFKRHPLGGGVRSPRFASPSKRRRVDGARPHVLIIVQEGETNTGDQRRLEQRLWERHRVPALRRSLQAIAKNGSIGSKGELRVDGVPCLVAYFRAGYTPNDYPDESCWEARALVERSSAVKCPSIPYHLVGCKKMQQALADPATLRRFCSNVEATDMESVFAPIYGLEESNQSHIAEALADPSDWLLKPQREGGGSLIHGEDMVRVLRGLTPAQRHEYILMRKIRPPRLPSIFVRDGAVVRDSRTVSELGVFGAVLSDGEVLHVNEASGTLLRSKSEKNEDGGVAAGVAYLDSPLLIP
eukprot:TRINITY_DN16063_c0_g1_i1.p1 TRINITY_DN16063_c0_g1~~TRINITY_DN16063_c0_g1_i1.p1  ORF type:complete len:545 (+),score=142.22 TRINITY_DN16063_c0_g1_i1:70-1635(+)